jgi:hypothetical protein
VYLVQVFFASFWSAGFETFFQVSTLASHWLEDCANFTPTAKENNQNSANYSWYNASNKQIRFYQYTLHNYIPFMISRNDKNKQLTLLRQRKLALTSRNTLYAT